MRGKPILTAAFLLLAWPNVAGCEVGSSHGNESSSAELLSDGRLLSRVPNSRIDGTTLALRRAYPPSRCGAHSYQISEVPKPWLLWSCSPQAVIFLASSSDLNIAFADFPVVHQQYVEASVSLTPRGREYTFDRFMLRVKRLQKQKSEVNALSIPNFDLSGLDSYNISAERDVYGSLGASFDIYNLADRVACRIFVRMPYFICAAAVGDIRTVIVRIPVKAISQTDRIMKDAVSLSRLVEE